jgi:transcriptional regulator with XRE-family HTH domain
MKELFKRLSEDFADKEYAHSYMEGHAISRIAAQVYALRRQRGWSQEELSAMSGIAQERISKIESADFNSLTMKTLQKLSKAFDVYLHISFAPFTKGIIDIGNLHPWQLEVASRVDDLESSAVTYGTLLTLTKGALRLGFTNEVGTKKPHVFSCERASRTEHIQVVKTASTMGDCYV